MYELPVVSKQLQQAASSRFSIIYNILFGDILQWLKNGGVAQRVVLGVMAALGVANVFMMRYCLSIAITAMVRREPTVNSTLALIHPQFECPYDTSAANSTPAGVSEGGQLYDWDEKTQGMVLSAFYFGYIITHVPGSMLAERFGGKYTLGLSVLSTALLTLLTPFTAHTLGAPGLMALRFISGLGEGPKFPALATLLAAWAPPLEQSRLISVCFAGAQLGMIIGNSLGGLLVQYYGWPSVFYAFGSVGFLWFAVWCLVCYNDPDSHPFISDKERTYLGDTIGTLKRDKDLAATPWGKLVTSAPVWALVIAEIGHCWGLYTLTTDLPKYLSDVMHFNIAQSGLLSAVPFLAMWLMSMVLGVVADWILTKGYFSTWRLRTVFATIGQVGPGVGVVLASYAGCDRTSVILLLSVSMATMSACYSSIRVNSLDLSPNYTGSIMALQNGFSAVSGMITPYLIGILTPNRSLMEWRLVFYVMFAVLFISNCIFLWLGSAEVQPWNTLKKDSEEGNHQPEVAQENDLHVKQNPN